jgi:heme exporter protein B
MSFWRQTLTIARRDLRVEGRAGEVTSVVLPFAAVAVFVVPLATDTLQTRLADLAWPVYWLVALLFGMQVTLRQTGSETATQRRHLALLGVDPAARFAGRALAAASLILMVLVVTAPLVILFYDPEPVSRLWVMAPILVLLAAGVAMLATLAGDVTVGIRSRSALAPLIVAPLAVPLLVGAASTLQSLTRGDGSLTGALLMVVSDLSLAITGVVAARPLEDATL